MKPTKTTPAQRAAYFQTLPDSIIDRQLARAKEKDAFDKAQAEWWRRKHKPSDHLLALEDEKRRRDEAARTMNSRLAK